MTLKFNSCGGCSDTFSLKNFIKVNAAVHELTC